MDQVMLFRQALNDGASCQFEGYITADYGDRLYTFTLDCQVDALGNVTFSVRSPQSICGITGKIGEEKGILTFDEQVLAFPLLADGYISPVSGPWLMVRALKAGYIRGCSQEEQKIRVTIDDSYEEDTIQVDVWLDEQNCPMQADFLWKGRRIITMEVKNFRYL